MNEHRERVMERRRKVEEWSRRTRAQFPGDAPSVKLGRRRRLRRLGLAGGR